MREQHFNLLTIAAGMAVLRSFGNVPGELPAGNLPESSAVNNAMLASKVWIISRRFIHTDIGWKGYVAENRN